MPSELFFVSRIVEMLETVFFCYLPLKSTDFHYCRQLNYWLISLKSWRLTFVLFGFVLRELKVQIQKSLKVLIPET